MHFALALAPYVPLQSPSDGGQAKVLEKFYTLDFPEGPQEIALALDIAAEIFKSRRPNAPRRTTRQNSEPEGRRTKLVQSSPLADTQFIPPALEDVPCCASGDVRSTVPGWRRILGSTIAIMFLL
jgi:hypothetical protein